MFKVTLMLVSMIMFGSIQTSRLPNPPPPPPGQGHSWRSKTSLSTALSRADPDLLRTALTLGRRSQPSTSKWVHCNREWRQVTRSSCPIVFLDPDFSEHQEFCSAYGKHSGVYSGTFHFWLFDPATRGGPFQYCFHMPSSFCEECARHWILSGKGTNLNFRKWLITICFVTHNPFIFSTEYFLYCLLNELNYTLFVLLWQLRTQLISHYRI